MYLEFKILRATLWNSSIFAYHLRIREIEYLLHDHWSLDTGQYF